MVFCTTLLAIFDELVYHDFNFTNELHLILPVSLVVSVLEFRKRNKSKKNDD